MIIDKIYVSKTMSDSVHNSFNKIMLRAMLTHRVKHGTIDAEWDETRHPRGKDGRFAKTAGKSGGNREREKAKINGTIKKPDIPILRSLSASSRISHEPIDVPEYESKAYFAEGKRIQNVEVFAGKNKKDRIKDIKRLVSTYLGTNEGDWEKVKGYAQVVCDGEEHRAEIHWYHSDKTGGVEYKVKIQTNGDVWLDEN